LALVVGAEDAASVHVVLALALAFFLAAALAALAALAELTATAAGPLGLHDGEDSVGILAVDIDAAPAQFARGQTLGQPRPGLAAVVGLVDAGLVAELGPRRGAGEGVAAEGVCTGVEDVRIGGVDGQVGGAGGVIDEQHLVPGLARVGRLEHSAFGVRPPGVA